jgi:predicted lipoprotein with Yx(FWY)xxD motif
MLAVRGRIVAMLLVVVLMLLLIPTALAQGATVTMTHDPILGNILTDSQGRTLYHFLKDTPNVSSACYGRCATTWPPLLIAEGNPVAGEGVNGDLLGVLVRTDGTRQVMYNGLPLYYYAPDTKPGDTKGQGVGSIWFIVKPNTTLASNQPVVVRAAQNPSLGTILTDSQGRTLYHFTKDKENLSVCYDGCANVWPPLLAGAGGTALGEGVGGDLGVTLRNDGNHQVTYGGKPLYYYAPDTNPGDTKGQGIGQVWFVITPVAASTPAAAPAPAPATLPRTGEGHRVPLGALIALALLLIVAGGAVVGARRSTHGRPHGY